MQCPFSSVHSFRHLSSTTVPASAQSFGSVLKLLPYQSCKWEIFPPNITGLCFNEKRNSGLARGAWMAALSLIDTGMNIAANMFLSILSYSYTSFSISPPLVLCFFDLDFLSQLPAQKRDFCWQSCYHTCLVGKMWRRWWLGVWLHCCAVPGLAAVLILLSPASKQQENEKAISKLISSPTHYQIHP